MNRVTVDDNAFNDFLTKKSRLKFAEKREAKGKKPFLGIGAKQLKLKNEGLTAETPEEISNQVYEATNPDPSALSDYEELMLANQGMGVPNVEEAGFFAKNKKALMIGGAIVLLGGVFYMLKKRGIIGK